MNTISFVSGQHPCFAGSYARFEQFGGPSLYFHRESLLAAETAFLDHRHIEMLYATLTAWGMRRMGNPGKVKTRLTDWKRISRLYH